MEESSPIPDEPLTAVVMDRYKQLSEEERRVIGSYIAHEKRGVGTFTPKEDIPHYVENILRDIEAKGSKWTLAGNQEAQLFLPFLWPAINIMPQAEKWRKDLCAEAIASIGLLALLQTFPCFAYADFNGIDFSRVRLDGIDLKGANFSRTTLNSTSFAGCSLQGVDFTGTKGLTVAQLLTADNLYQTKFDVEQIKKTAAPEDLQKLEDKILLSYQKNAKNSEEQSLLKMGEFLGFSPLEWAAEPDKIQNLLASEPNLLTDIQKGLSEIVPVFKATADIEEIENMPKGTYYTKRFETNEYKSFFKPTIRESRQKQINDLHKLIGSPDEKVTVKQAVNTFIGVMNEIKAEKNIFPSELEKQVKQLFTDAITQAMSNKPSSLLKPSVG